MNKITEGFLMKIKRILTVLIALILSVSTLLTVSGCDDDTETYVITFSVDEGVTMPIKEKRVKGNEKIGELPVPKKAGYEFAYWYYEDTNSRITESTDYLYKADITLKAHFNEIIYISFDLDGGTYGGKTELPDISATRNEMIGTLPSPVKTDEVFSHWQITDGTPVYEDTFYDFTEKQIELKAVYVSTEYYRIEYNLDGGYIDGERQTVYDGSEDITLPTPEKDGYIFSGWIDKNGASVTSVQKDSTGDMELTAVWVSGTYRVYLTLSSKVGSKLVSGKFDKNESYYTVGYGVNVSDYFPAESVTNITEGYEFIGWVTVISGVFVSVNESTTFTEEVFGSTSKNIRLVAQYARQK